MPDLPHGVARKFQRGKPREMADVPRGELVDRHAGLNIRAGRLANANAGQKAAAGAGVVAGTVGAGRGVFVVQPAEDLQPVLQLGERRQRAVQLEFLVLALGPPSVLNCAVRKIDKRHPQRCAARRDRELCCRIGGRERRAKQRPERRQRHASADPAQEATAGNSWIGIHCSWSRLFATSFQPTVCAPSAGSSSAFFAAKAGRVSPPLEGGRFNDSRQKGRKPPIRLNQPLDDGIDRVGVLVLQPAADGVR